MNAFHWLLLLFLLIPLCEIYLLVQVGGIVGALPTVLLVVGTAVLGAFLVKIQGFSTLTNIQASLSRQEIPAVELLEGAAILIAGALLLTPGFLTDAAGFLCLVPPLRRRVIWAFLARQGLTATQAGSAHAEGRVIEGEYRRDDD